jgi:hypothetical protein
MGTLADTLAKLKSTIIQTSTQGIDAKLDQAVKDIVKYKSHTGRNGYIELVKDLIGKTAEVKLSGSGGGLFQQQGVGPAAFGQGSRIMRYKIYQSIVSHIPYCHRALSVLVDNILSPDDITKEALDVKPKKHIEDETPTASRVRYVKEVIEVLGLEKNLNQVVRCTLLFGDFFCEIGEPKTALTSRSILTEADYTRITEHSVASGIKDKFSVTIEGMNGSKEENKQFEISIDWSAFLGGERVSETDFITQDKKEHEDEKSEKRDKKKNRKDFRTLKDLKLIFHDPKNVLKLQSSLFPVCFGYLVFPPSTLLSGQMLSDTAINGICIAILRNLEKKIPNMKEFNGDEELKDIIKGMISQSDLSKSLEIRFVPTSKMTHFMVPTTKYFPYGESIFDSGQFTAKVMIAMETALTIARLSRSTEKRKIAVEIGLPRDARVAIEAMKEEFRKRKISLDSFGTIDTIPSMITTFEDIYIPQRDGKPFVDVSTFTEGHMDTRNKVDELKLMRDQVVAGLAVPPSFIGIEENLSNKAALSEENILFARAVINHQKYLNHQLIDLLEKVFEIINPELAMTIFDSVYVCFPTPKSLQFERESRYMNELTNLIESLERLGIPKEYSKKKYLPQMDWDEIKKYEVDRKVETALDPAKKAEDDQFGYGPMGGVGGAPAPGLGGMGGPTGGGMM